MSGETKTSKLAGKLLAVATKAVQDRTADASDAVQASLITTLTLARMCSPNDPTDEAFDECVDEMSGVLLKHAKKWNEKGGA